MYVSLLSYEEVRKEKRRIIALSQARILFLEACIQVAPPHLGKYIGKRFVANIKADLKKKDDWKALIPQQCSVWLTDSHCGYRDITVSICNTSNPFSQQTKIQARVPPAGETLEQRWLDKWAESLEKERQGLERDYASMDRLQQAVDDINQALEIMDRACKLIRCRATDHLPRLVEN